ncbi:unnamed protein product [Notodromas monacha]|uniref:Arginase n=1 Tax=Notodromas monacha TaxID=399045 RepID=A0A7R9BVI6_9CRUS|nr:unnamed protein product [Notodromas monacha]CAG0922539.1 unnamed protein product [Notodromas monacha]
MSTMMIRRLSRFLAASARQNNVGLVLGDGFGNAGYHSMEPSPMTVGIIGAAFRGGQRRVGTDHGPHAIRHGGFLEAAIRALGHEIKDYGDLRVEDLQNIQPKLAKTRINNVHIIGSYMKEMSQRVQQSLRENKLTIVLGGDHSIAVGTVHGHATTVVDDLAVVYVDAHADINTPMTSHTGRNASVAAVRRI